ncbi:hypothetical protein ACFSTE_02820 [Aquimarina hainanensis]|uniref:DUF4625 domain-containing protein n=1 Tax=Aquimarina hainanensis TaxID=1578017 RepID=A0ABW5N3S5_9FLAO
MKRSIKFLSVLILSIVFCTSCSNDDDGGNTFDENQNAERFSGIEIGNAAYKVPRSNVDVHMEFDYEGAKKVDKIYLDITPVSTPNMQEGEVAWEVKDHLIPLSSDYQGKLNPHIHYHVYFDPDNKYEPKIKVAQGTYKLKITVIEEDKSKSVITKEFEIVQKFFGTKVAEQSILAAGSVSLPTEFTYDSGANTVDEIAYELWFEEWREGQNVAPGKWDKINVVLPADLYKGKVSPKVVYELPMNVEFPENGYWLNIYVKESSEKERVKLSVPFKIEAK